MTADTMLIVDDSKMSRMMIRSIVLSQHPDWNIIEADCGQNALDLTESANVDVMTLDFNMPGMDGIALAEIMVKRFPNAHVALLTANIQFTIKERAEALGVEFVHKPITEEKILGFIAEKV